MVEAEGAHNAYGSEVVGGPEAARGHIAFVLDGVVAAGRREICSAASVSRSVRTSAEGAPWTMIWGGGERMGGGRGCVVRGVGLSRGGGGL